MVPLVSSASDVVSICLTYVEADLSFLWALCHKYIKRRYTSRSHSSPQRSHHGCFCLHSTGIQQSDAFANAHQMACAPKKWPCFQ